MPSLKENVFRLDVSVDDPVVMRELERLGHLTGDPDGLIHRELALPLQPFTQRLSLDERHHEVRQGGSGAGLGNHAGVD